MTREALKEAARYVLNHTKQKLIKNADFPMTVFYVLPNGDINKEAIEDPAFVNSGQLREILFKTFRQRARELNAEAETKSRRRYLDHYQTA